jgi:hypothetical protein
VRPFTFGFGALTAKDGVLSAVSCRQHGFDMAFDLNFTPNLLNFAV